MEILLENQSQNIEKYKELTAHSIGGSDAYDAAIVDEKSEPMKVYLKLSGHRAEFEDNEAMHFGRELEDFVAEEFARRYVADHPGAEVKLTKFDSLVRHPQHKFIHATPDYLVDINGERSPLQCKTARWSMLPLWEDGGCPNRYRTQVMTELSVLEQYRRGFLACFIMEPAFRYVEIQNDEYVTELTDRLVKFHSDFEQKIPPPLRGMAGDFAKHFLFETDESEIIVDESSERDFNRLCGEYHAANENEKAGKEGKKEPAGLLLMIAGHAKKVFSRSGNKITVVRKQFDELDVKRWKEAEPEKFAEVFSKFKRTQKQIYPLVTYVEALEVGTDRVDSPSGEVH